MLSLVLVFAIHAHELNAQRYVCLVWQDGKTAVFSIETMDGKRTTVDLDESSFNTAASPGSDPSASAGRGDNAATKTGSRSEDEL